MIALNLALLYKKQIDIVVIEQCILHYTLKKYYQLIITKY